MIDYKKTIEDIFIESKFKSNYYLNLNNSILAQGTIINNLIKILDNDEKEVLLNHVFDNDEEKINDFVDEYKGVDSFDNNESGHIIEPINFKNSIEYKKMMNGSFRKDNSDEKREHFESLTEKTKILSSVFANVKKINNSNDFDIEDILILVEDLFDDDKRKQLEKTIDTVVKEQSSSTNSITPDLVNVNQGESKFLTIGETNTLFPEFFEVNGTDIFKVAIPLDEANGEKMYNFISPITYNFKNVRDVEDEELTDIFYSKNAQLYTKENIQVTFKEIKNEFNKYLNQDIFKDDNFDDKLNDAGIEMKRYNKNILKMMSLIQNNIEISELSTDPELAKNNELIGLMNEKSLTNFFITLIERNPDKKLKIDYAKAFGIKGDNGKEIDVDDQMLGDNDQKNFNHIILTKLFQINSEEVTNELNELNNSMEKIILIQNKNITESHIRTNIPIIKSRSGNKYPNFEMDKELTKILLKNLSKNKGVHIYSDPGTGKTENIKAIFENILGYKCFDLEVSVDPETYVKNLGDDNKPIIGEKGTQDSVVKKTRDWGGKSFVFGDELAPKVSQLKGYGMSEGLNSALTDIAKDPNCIFIGASNFSIDLNEDIASSAKDRFIEEHLDTKSWEVPEYIQSKMLYLHFNNFSKSFDISNNLTFINTIKKIKEKEEVIFEEYFDLIKDEDIKEVLDLYSETLLDNDFDSEKYDEFVDSFENLGIEEEKEIREEELESGERSKRLTKKSKLQKLSATLIKEYLNFKNIHEHIIEKEELNINVDKMVEIEIIIVKLNSKIDKMVKEYINSNGRKLSEEELESLKIIKKVEIEKIKNSKAEYSKTEIKELDNKFAKMAMKYIENNNSNLSEEALESLKITKKIEISKIENSKAEFSKIIKYLNTDKLNVDDIKHPSDINYIVDFLSNFLENNKEVLYSKFSFDIDENSNDNLIKEQIKFTLNQVIHKYNIDSNAFLANERNTKNIVDREPSLNNRMNKLLTDYKTSTKSFNNTNLLATLPLNANKELLSINIFNEKNDFSPFKTNNYVKNDVTFKKSKLFNHDEDSLEEESVDDERNFQFKFKSNNSNKLDDMLFLLSYTAANINKYIRKEIQGLNDNHEYEDFSDYNEETASVNKFFYRNLDALLREMYSGMNTTSGTSIDAMFDQFFEKIQSLMPDSNYKEVLYDNILTELKENKPNEIANANAYISNLEQ